MSYRVDKLGGMNLNREQFLKAVERGQELLVVLKKDYPELKLSPVFSRFGPRSGQCDLTTNLRKIVTDFPEMLGEGCIHRERTHGTQKSENVDAVSSPRSSNEEKKLTKSFLGPDTIKTFCGLLIQLKQGEPVEKEVHELERRLLEPELKLYCADVLIEYRPGNLKYESLRRLQQDSRLPPGIKGATVRVIGPLWFLTR